MKKSLIVISFAFIFLLSMSIVSAGFWDWLNGDVTSPSMKGQFATSKTGISSTSGNPETSVRTSFAKTSRFGAAGYCPTGWTPTKTIDNKACCIQKSGKSLFNRG